MALQFPNTIERRPPFTPVSDPNIQAIIEADSAIVRTLFTELQEEWSDLEKYRNYYNGEQKFVFGTEKFKEFFPDFEGFEDNWCQVVVDAVADKIKLIGVSIDSEEDGNSDESPDDATNDISTQIWNVFRDNDIDEQQNDLTEGTLVEGRAAVIVWPDDEIGARIDWQPAQLVKVRYSEEDYKRVDFAVKRWETSSGEIRVNVYDAQSVRKYTESRTPRRQDGSKVGISRTIPDKLPNVSLTPRVVPDESWPLPHNFGMVPVVEFPNKRGSELSDVIPLQDGINYQILAAFIASEFSAIPPRVFFTHLKAPTGGWSNAPGRVWHLPPLLDNDGKPYYGQMDEFSTATLGDYRSLVEMLLQHLALTSKTPVRMFFKSDRGGRGDAPSGESQLVEDEPLLDKCEDRQTRMGNRWFQVAKLVAKAIGIDSRIRGEMIWQDPRSKYRSSLLDEAIKLANPKTGLGLPIEWVVKHLGLTPEELEELQDALQAQKEEQEAKEEQVRQDQLAMAASRGEQNGGQNQGPSSSSGSGSASSSE